MRVLQLFDCFGRLGGRVVLFLGVFLRHEPLISRILIVVVVMALRRARRLHDRA